MNKYNDNKLSLELVLKCIYKQSGKSKCCDNFNKLLNENIKVNMELSTDVKNKITPSFLRSEPLSLISEGKNVIAEKRYTLYGYLKNNISDKYLTKIFSYNSNEPNKELIDFYTEVKGNYSVSIQAFLDDLLLKGRYAAFVKWTVFISCFAINESDERYDHLTGISVIVEKNYIGELNANAVIDNWINENLNKCDYDELVNVNIAANMGIRWIDKGFKEDLMNLIISKSKHINILITENEIAEIFSQFTREPGVYRSSDLTVTDNWKEYCSKFSDKITFKISKIPLLRRYIEFDFKHEKNSSIFVAFYTYGEAKFCKNHYLQLQYGENYYNLYKDEFNYLFNNDFSLLGNNSSSLFLNETKTEKDILERIKKLDSSDKKILLYILNRIK